jgi:hypothetical protein
LTFFYTLNSGYEFVCAICYNILKVTGGVFLCNFITYSNKSLLKD